MTAALGHHGNGVSAYGWGSKRYDLLDACEAYIIRAIGVSLTLEDIEGDILAKWGDVVHEVTIWRAGNEIHFLLHDEQQESAMNSSTANFGGLNEPSSLIWTQRWIVSPPGDNDLVAGIEHDDSAPGEYRWTVYDGLSRDVFAGGDCQDLEEAMTQAWKALYETNEAHSR